MRSYPSSGVVGSRRPKKKASPKKQLLLLKAARNKATHVSNCEIYIYTSVCVLSRTICSGEHGCVPPPKIEWIRLDYFMKGVGGIFMELAVYV